VPLSKLQSEILLLLAAHRNPESYIAGCMYLTRNGPRISGYIDIFHDREELVARAAEHDAAALQDACLRVHWQRREPTFFQALISRGDATTKLEWVVDSDFRFFPTGATWRFGRPADPCLNDTWLMRQ